MSKFELEDQVTIPNPQEETDGARLMDEDLGFNSDAGCGAPTEHWPGDGSIGMQQPYYPDIPSLKTRILEGDGQTDYSGMIQNDTDVFPGVHPLADHELVASIMLQQKFFPDTVHEVVAPHNANTDSQPEHKECHGWYSLTPSTLAPESLVSVLAAQPGTGFLERVVTDLAQADVPEEHVFVFRVPTDRYRLVEHFEGKLSVPPKEQNGMAEFRVSKKDLDKTYKHHEPEAMPGMDTIGNIRILRASALNYTPNGWEGVAPMSETNSDLLIPKEKPQLRELSDNPDLIEVRMNTYGVTKSDHSNPILMTIGLGPCVAVALYEPDSKVAGLVHMTAPGLGPRWKSPHQDILNMLTAMQRNGVSVEARKNIQAHLVGGWTNDDLAELAKERLHKLGIDQLITDLRTEGVDSHCIALDSRSGELFKLVRIMQGGMDEFDAMSSMIKTTDGARVTSDNRSLK